VRVPALEAEAARARLLILAPGGFEEIERGNELELAVYTDDAGEAAFVDAFPDARSKPVASDWDVRWREFHRAVRAGGLWVGPPWEEPPVGVSAVVIDPGRAFGTGAHPTTRACIELLAAEPRGSILDAGCGSGVLAVAAARLGFGPVVAVDLDPTAVEVAQENAARNGVEVAVRQLDVLRSELPQVDLVVANIHLAGARGLLARRPAPRAITSGYLAGEAPAARGWATVGSVEVDGWAAHSFEAR
jgi:ribosomal protein L11 methyltransferase